MIAATHIYNHPHNFYVPHFQVKLNGTELEDDVIRDVVEVSYRDKLNEIDAFEMTINNWNAAAFKTKYEPPSEPLYDRLFDPGKTLELSMGYVNDLKPMISGEITTLEPTFPEAGGPTLSVRGLNVLHKFRTEQHTYSWEDMRDSDIAQWLGQRPHSRNGPGLAMEVRINPLPSEQAQTYVFMDNQYDVNFLIERARQHDYEVVLRKDDDDEEYLYFGPSEARQNTVYQLEWGKSLSSFQPTLSTARQISEVCVRGWDRQRNRPIDECKRWQELYPRGSQERQRMEQLAQAFGNRKEIITGIPVHTRSDARTLAEKILRGQFKNMVKASGVTVGLPNLRAGRKVEITGVGKRFEGEYFITETKHTINDSGYKTTFQARREGPLQTQNKES